jgi:hypothetical protein
MAPQLILIRILSIRIIMPFLVQIEFGWKVHNEPICIGLLVVTFKRTIC